MVRSVLSILAGIVVLTALSFAIEAVVNPLMGIIQAGLTIFAMLSPERNHASRRQWVMIAILSVPAALAGGTLYKRGGTA